MSRPTLTRARESGVRWHGTVGKNVSQLKHCQTHLSETGSKCPDFCLDLEENGLFCHLWFLKQLFTVIILIKSAPSTATQSKIACVFSEGSEKLPTWYGSGKKINNKKKIKKSKNSKKIQKNYKKTWRPNIRVFACEPGSVLGYLITLLCTALEWSQFYLSETYRIVLHVPCVLFLVGVSIDRTVPFKIIYVVSHPNDDFREIQS